MKREDSRDDDEWMFIEIRIDWSPAKDYRMRYSSPYAVDGGAYFELTLSRAFSRSENHSQSTNV